MILTGVPLFLSEPIKCYYSPAVLGEDVVAAARGRSTRYTIRDRVARAARHEHSAGLQMLVGRCRSRSGLPWAPRDGGSGSPDSRSSGSHEQSTAM